MKKSIVFGFLIGLLCSVLFITFGKYLQESKLLDFVAIISTPLAKIISWISGWPLEQESGIMVYVIAILGSMPLYGLIIGFLIGYLRKRLNARNIAQQ